MAGDQLTLNEPCVRPSSALSEERTRPGLPQTLERNSFSAIKTNARSQSSISSLSAGQNVQREAPQRREAQDRAVPAAELSTTPTEPIARPVASRFGHPIVHRGISEPAREQTELGRSNSRRRDSPCLQVRSRAAA